MWKRACTSSRMTVIAARGTSPANRASIAARTTSGSRSTCPNLAFLDLTPWKTRATCLDFPVGASLFVGKALRGNLDARTAVLAERLVRCRLEQTRQSSVSPKKPANRSQSLGPEQPIHLPRAVFGLVVGGWSDCAVSLGPKPTIAVERRHRGVNPESCGGAA